MTVGKITALFTHCTPADEATGENEQRKHSGQRARIFGEVDPDTYDRDEVGALHLVEFEDGAIFEAYSDELTEWRLEA